MARLASRQVGHVSRRQLLGLGVKAATVGDWRASGYLHDALPGVYAVGHRAPSFEGELAAALLYAGAGAMLSHATALWWWGLTDRQPATIDVSTPCRHCSQPGITVHGQRRVERVWHKGFPLTAVEPTLLDFAVDASDDRLRRALAEADYRRMLDPAALSALAGRGRPGSANLGRVLAHHLPQLAGCRSELEQRFLLLCERHRLPLPEVNVEVEGLLVDAVWRERRVVVELDGGPGHATPARLRRDRRNELRLRAAGYLVLRYTWDQLIREPGLVMADLSAALRAPTA